MLNPLLYSSQEPMAVRGEHFLLRRAGIVVEVTCPGLPKLKGKGAIFLTTLRIVFVSADKPALGNGLRFEAFDFPLSTLSGESFNQPIFGANNLTGVVQPIQGCGLPGPASFKLSFNQGGVGSFLHLFIRALRELRSGGVSSGLGRMAAQGTLHAESSAFVDPSDPSVIFIAQPAVAVSTVPPEAYGPLATAIVVPSAPPAPVPQQAKAL